MRGLPHHFYYGSFTVANNSMKHEESWIALAEVLGPRSHALKPLLGRFETPERLFEASEEELRCCEELSDLQRNAILQKSTHHRAAEIALWCHRHGVRILTPDCEEYPAFLKNIDEPPAVLYARGKLSLAHRRPVIGVVGTRKPDAYGEAVAYKLSFELAAAGAVIVSGMAEGLDGIAAAAAINAGGDTVAVLGCGIDIAYPKKHTRLAAEIAEHGVLVTEYPPGTAPSGWNFPARNRLISALSGALLVVEAGEGSGALITARYAVVQGKELFAVPGDITSPRSVGTNRLILAGATPALDSEEILAHFRFFYRDTVRIQALPEAMQYSAISAEALRRFRLRPQQEEATAKPDADQKKRRSKRRKKEEVEPPAPPVATAPDTSALSSRQRELYALLPDAPFAVDALIEKGVAVSEAVSTLTVLEIYGLLRSLPGGLYEKK